MMNIHLSKPGGQREGPFTLEQINEDLAAQKYHDSDYWAWYEGLNEWVPLHQVPGIIRSPSSEPQEIPSPETTSKAAGGSEVLYRETLSSPEEVMPQEQTSTDETDLSEVTSSPEEEIAQEELVSPSESITDEQSAVEEEQEAPRQEETAPSAETDGSESQISAQETVSQEESAFPEEAALEPEGSQPEETFQEEPVQQEAEAPQETLPEEEAAAQELSAQTEEPAQPAEAPPSLSNQLFSGMPFEALEQVILLSSGDPQNASRSAITTGMLEAAIGSELDVIREKIPRDAMGGCAFLEKLRAGGQISDAALRAAAKLKPELVRQAREGLYRICVRTYPIETGEMVALFLFYNKQML